MRSRLLPMVAVSALLTSCGAGTTAGVSAAGTANCRAADLTWTLTLLTAEGTTAPDPANAELAAVNSGTRPCALAGYPKLELHRGKGPQARGSGEGRPAAVTLGAGRAAVFALRWPGTDGKGTSGTCTPRVTTATATVAAPGEAAAVRVPVTDRSGRPAEATVCGPEVRMSPPVTR
ncbi:DUF4232 domain-containing protein [Kitasatospora sp. NPDC059408]|uniref:DUF4232 domain-containing protein n=1 Tax=Kitasatospora sp. NPDC059408 TaxID=3346823 RepID=UPI003684083F